MIAAVEFLVTFACVIFTGAAVYITFVEYPRAVLSLARGETASRQPLDLPHAEPPLAIPGRALQTARP